MTFEELFTMNDITSSKEVELNGWIVVIDKHPYLIEENYNESYENNKKIKIENRDLLYVLEKSVTLMGGGRSSLFHRARITGRVITSPELTIIPSEIYIAERGKNLEKVDISESNIEKFKSKRGDMFDNSKKMDWFDIYND